MGFKCQSHDPHGGTRIDPVLARSWLLTNGLSTTASPRRHGLGRHRRPDIEDAVAPKDKVVAREGVVQWLAAAIWDCSSTDGTPWWADDLGGIERDAGRGVMLAMVESVDHVTETAKRLPGLPIVALVETARGLERITEIASAKGTFRLAFGIATFVVTPDSANIPPHLAYARSYDSPSPPRRLESAGAHRRAQWGPARQAQRGHGGLGRIRHDRQDLPHPGPVRK